MKLTEQLARDFSATTRDRGRNYFWHRRVRIQHGSGSQVKAFVAGGSQDYEVSLDWKNGVLFGFCDCPYYDSNGYCKHLWATLLAADEHDYLSEAAATKELYLDCLGIEDEDLEETDLSAQPPAAIAKPAPPPAWMSRILGISSRCQQAVRPTDRWPEKRSIVYVVDLPGSATAGRVTLRLLSHERKADGTYTRAVPLALKRGRIAELRLPEDREILSALAGGVDYYSYYGSYGRGDEDQLSKSYQLAHPLAERLLPIAVRSGRCYLQDSSKLEDWTPLSWYEDDAWKLELQMRPDAKGWEVVGMLRRGEERMELPAALLITPGGFVFTRGRVAPLAADTPFEWISQLQNNGSIKAAAKHKEEFLAALLCSPGLPALEVPPELSYEEITIAPRPGLRIHPADPYRSGGKLRGELSFDYQGRMTPAEEPTRGFYDSAGRRFLRRDAAAEEAAASLLTELGLKFRAGSYWEPKPLWELAPSKLPRIARGLVEAGWHLEAEGKIFRRPGTFHIEVSTGVDWFELHGEVEYGETTAKLPELLQALHRGENVVRLGDGTYGLLPEEWLRRIGMLAGAGAPQDGHIRFRSTQAGLLDALLAAQPEARCDEAFARVREELQRFQGIAPAQQPDGFVGRLRNYQCEGLGWMEFLRRFSFGGCLADDMGVGKTAQVLALLETRRELRAAGEALAPSLVVVPRSLVFNWKQEAQRFTPQLRVLDYTGMARNENDFGAYDVVLTTYGTLRRDAARVKDMEFDYVVLDEAQAIKNASTESAKAARLLQGGHRLALSGTPVENHLGELWSLFEFLNPGLLGAASVFKLANGTARDLSEDTTRLLAHALRPFILRRTKEQVARELPAKTEQTMYCEMEPRQRKLYDELRQHYRNALLKRIETEGLAKSKIQVLEALLRLRQAACHPGLLDSKRRSEGSAKLDMLLEQLREVMDEGHKALVFSQFTTLLGIVRARLNERGMTYEYLDGATRDRQARVEHFQNDPDCRLFLISLKAGGLGLNLTAAEYVFLLDPWWNPAVEAQAVDRAHRIGQTRQVFAYRLIARDTVEEKILELQKNKRDLATAIISADNSLIRNLQREDLELLLS